MKRLILSLTESPYEVRYLKMFYETSREINIDSDIYYYSYGNLLSEYIPSKQIICDDAMHNYLINKDFRIYDNFFQCAIEMNANVIIPRVINPEFLYSTISALENCPKISLSGYAFELFIRSASRANIVKKILEISEVSGLLLHTIGGKDAKWPPNINLPDKLFKKVKLTSEPLFDPLSKYTGDKNKCRNDLDLNVQKNIILFFGSMYPWKGADTLLDCLKVLKNNVQCIFAGNTETYGSNLDNFNKDNIILIDKPSDDLMFKLFHASDIVVCPYGPSYAYGTSSVCISSILSSKPVVCPFIEPFVSVIEKYKCGELFTSNKVHSLANAIDKIFNEEKIDKYSSHRSLFLKSIESWNNILNYHLKNT